MIKVKFCGLTRPEDIRIVNKLKPDYIGFVFYEKSKRNVTEEKARELKEKLDDSIKAVGVFVDEDENRIAGIANEKIIDIIQLHGHEDEVYIARLRKLTDAKIIKAFQIKNNLTNAEKGNCISDHSVQEKTNTDAIKRINASSADMVLVDSGQGTGKTFDWDVLGKIERPFFLAGGLNTENVESVITGIMPYGIDLSSGIETDGIKDESKMNLIMRAVRGN
ncbi:phosphoribosylanthranilate isomerase [Butyrivibrio sp. AC2005]|uniref:phosphoribosylanthranilate isomerase n=1 Tax=Butyrivibrio sp. AC2005 TaxID=1280672 RepID=UPI000402D37F|nr:phosphoribosylanthranilate isomerase [Butyrivibrio sp. AC2005]